MRKHAAWYIKGLNNCTEVKNRLNLEADPEKIMGILNEYKEYLMKNDL